MVATVFGNSNVVTLHVEDALNRFKLRPAELTTMVLTGERPHISKCKMTDLTTFFSAYLFAVLSEKQRDSI